MNIINANAAIQHFDKSNSYHQYLFGLLLTDEVMQVATALQCFWFLDVVAAYQHQFYKHAFQTWMLKKQAGATAFIIAEDGNGKVLIKHTIRYNNIKTNQLKVCVDGNVILLADEYQEALNNM